MNPDITFILVRPCYAGNIGAAARAIKNMGFHKLVLVDPKQSPGDVDAIKMAVGAKDLLKKAKVFTSLKEAIKPFHYLIGTSRRFGRHRRNFVSLPDLKPLLPLAKKIGILFGSEDKGLNNEDLALCHKVVTIPSNPDFPSMNLAQAVMVVAYELRKVAASPIPSISLASLEDVEGMFRQLETTLAEIGFFPHGNPFMVMRTLRGMFGRSGVTTREIRIIRGICRQMIWFKNVQNR